MEGLQERPATSGFRFLVIFAAYTLFLFSLVLVYPSGWVQGFKEYTAAGVSLFWRAFSVPLYADGELMNFMGFSMIMTLECTALYYLLIAVAAILAHPAHSPRYKVYGILFFSIAIFLLNAVRIGVVGFIGRYENDIFDFVHTYLWQGTFALAVCFLWITWDRGRGTLTRSFVLRIFLAVVGATVCYGCLYVSLGGYASLLSTAVTILAYPISLLTSVPSGFIARGDTITYQLSWGTVDYIISVEVMNSVIFAALVTATAQRNAVPTLVKRACFGLLMLFLVHLFSVMAYGISLENRLSEERLMEVIWLARGWSIVAPLLIWLASLKIFSQPLSLYGPEK